MNPEESHSPAIGYHNSLLMVPYPSLEVPVIPGSSRALVVAEKESKVGVRYFSAPIPAAFHHQEDIYMKGRRTQLRPHHVSTDSVSINS